MRTIGYIGIVLLILLFLVGGWALISTINDVENNKIECRNLCASKDKSYNSVVNNPNNPFCVCGGDITTYDLEGWMGER